MSPTEPTGHYGPGHGDPAPVDPDPDHAFARWRELHLKEIDEDFAAWRESGETRFPHDFERWRRERRAKSESEKAALLFERS